jgi:N-acetylmuramoyl-L-alanine amidase
MGRSRRGDRWIHGGIGEAVSWLPSEMQSAVEPLTDWQVVAVCLYGEARSEPIQGIVAVANVIKHRVDAKTWYGDGWRGVVLKPWQFSMWSPKGGQKNYERVLMLAQKLAAGEAVTDPKWLQCAWTARGVIGNFLADNVKGSNHYHTVSLMPRPEWARSTTPLLQVGAHVFYKL